MMLEYRTFDEIVDHPGLRVVLVQGMPSPWGQAAKTFFELKGLDYVAAPWAVFEPNDAIRSWGAADSAPIVAWRDERPVHGWLDILLLVERIQPLPALLPSDVMLRAQVIGLSNEICGRGGLAWNRRLQMVQPAFADEVDPSPVRTMGLKYGYADEEVAHAGQRVAESLKALTRQLKDQYTAGSPFFVGDRLTAVDIYWTAFANFFVPLPSDQCPMPDQFRPTFTATDPVILDALDPILLEHRDRIFRKHFRSPMEL
jgi:glutathione S-transferase